jgi:hypothetical protein
MSTAHLFHFLTDWWKENGRYAARMTDDGCISHGHIDLERTRWTAFQNRVPQKVIYVNAAEALLAAMMVGYSFGVNGRRNIFSTCVLALAITLVLAVIIDRDRPRSGFIRANQKPMIDLLHLP